MPLFKAVTRKSTVAWKSPDGQRTIHEVVLEVEGEPFKTQTFSEKIAEVGFEGEVEVYDKNGKQFVRQAPKEGYTSGTGASSYGQRGGGVARDSFTMYMSYAKDLLVACINRGDKISYEDAIQEVIGAGHTLYEARPDNSGGSTTPDVKKDVAEDIKDEPISLEDFDKMIEKAQGDKFDI